MQPQQAESAPRAGRWFADRGVRLRLVVVGLLLAGLGGGYAAWALGAEHGWRWAMESPAERDGATMVFPLWEVTRVVDAEHYAISKVVQDVPMVGEARDLKVGDTVSVIGRFDAAGPHVRVEVRELHVLRVYKNVLGIVGFLGVLVWLPFAFRWQRGRLTERG